MIKEEKLIMYNNCLWIPESELKKILKRINSKRKVTTWKNKQQIRLMNQSHLRK